MNNEILEKIAINIPTDVYCQIVEYFENQNFFLKKEYTIFDKAIDYDFYEFEKNGESVSLIWDIWIEGEMIANELIFNELEKTFGIKFQFGEESYLKKVKKEIQIKSPLFEHYQQ